MSLRIAIIEQLSRFKRKSKSFFLRNILGYINIDASAIIEGGVILDKVYPESIFIGPGTLVARGAVILSHSHVYRDADNKRFPAKLKTNIGSNCFIGHNVIIHGGVNIGDECVIGSGCVVTKDIPSNSIAFARGIAAQVEVANINTKVGGIIQ